MGRRGNLTTKIMLLALLPFIIWIIAFEFVPILSMIVVSFQQEGGQGFTLGQYTEILTNPLYLDSIKSSVIVAIVSSVIGIIIAIFSSYAMTRISANIRDRLLMITNMVSNFAGVPLAFAYIVLLGGTGMLTLLFQKLGWGTLGSFDLFSWTGLTVVYIYVQVPLGILLLYPTFYGIKEEW